MPKKHGRKSKSSLHREALGMNWGAERAEKTFWGVFMDFPVICMKSAREARREKIGYFGVKNKENRRAKRAEKKFGVFLYYYNEMCENKTPNHQVPICIRLQSTPSGDEDPVV